MIDIAVFRKVGLAVAVANARPVAKAEAHIVTKAKGGRGAVREIIEKVLSAQGKWRSTVEAFAK